MKKFTLLILVALVLALSTSVEAKTINLNNLISTQEKKSFKFISNNLVARIGRFNLLLGKGVELTSKKYEAEYRVIENIINKFDKKYGTKTFIELIDDVNLKSRNSTHIIFKNWHQIQLALGNFGAGLNHLTWAVAHELGHSVYRFMPAYIYPDNKLLNKIEEYKADFLSVYIMKKLSCNYEFGCVTKAIANLMIQYYPRSVLNFKTDHPEGLCRIAFAFLSECICAFLP